MLPHCTRHQQRVAHPQRGPAHPGWDELARALHASRRHLNSQAGPERGAASGSFEDAHWLPADRWQLPERQGTNVVLNMAQTPATNEAVGYLQGDPWQPVGWTRQHPQHSGGVMKGKPIVRALDVVTGRPVVVPMQRVAPLPDRLKRDFTALTRENFVLVGSRWGWHAMSRSTRYCFPGAASRPTVDNALTTSGNQEKGLTTMTEPISP